MFIKKWVENAPLYLAAYVPRLFYRAFYRPKAGTLAAIIDGRAKKAKSFYVLQVGGNDGFIRDPMFKFIKKYPWEVIIAEPQVSVFKNKLSKTYRNENKVRLENVAISNESGMRSLYKIAISESRWATGLASFDRDTLELQIQRGYVDECAKKEGVELPSKLEDYVKIESVMCVTILDLLKKYKFSSLDLLQIDTEGYDFEIIKSIDFDKLLPSMISYENEHLSEKDNGACELLLRSKGYSVMVDGRDTIAYLK